MPQPSTRVLLIDDEESDHLMTGALLSRIEGASFELEWASSFDDGMQLLSTERHDVCLLDYFLRDRTGIELLRVARSRGIRTPIILLTGKGSREVDLQAMEAGAVDYLMKGQNDPDALERAIRYAVERHRAQEELRRSEERLRAMFDHLPLGLYRVSAEGEYMEANPALIRMLEFPERERLKEDLAFNFFVGPKDRPRFLRTLEDHGEVVGLESQIRTSSGRPIRVRTTARVHRGPDGRVEYVEGTVEDVTGLRSGDALESEASAFRTLMAEVEVGVAVVAPDGKLRERSARLDRLLGHAPESSEGQAVWELVQVDDQPTVVRALEEIADGRSDRETASIRLVRGIEPPLSARVTLVPVTRKGGALEAILVTFHEMTSAEP